MEKAPRRRGVLVLVTTASLVLLLAVFGVWAKRQLLETDTWVETSSELLEDEEIREATAAFIVDTIYEHVDVEADLAGRLPQQAKPLAAPAAAGLRQLAGEAADEALQRPRVQQAWETVNREAHDTLLAVVKDGDSQPVTIDLGTLVEQIAARSGIDASGKIPPDAGQIELVKPDQLSTAAKVVNLLETLAIVLSFLAVGLYALAIYRAKGARRQTLKACGFAIAAVGVLVLVIRSLAGDALVDSVAATAASAPAAASTWAISTSLLQDGGAAIIAYGLAIVFGAWLAAPGPAASSVRRTLTPALRERGTAYAGAAVIVLLVLWWSPTEGTSRLLPLLVLTALLVAGVEGLRRQALAEFPEETWERTSQRLRRHLRRDTSGS